jgi:hypothetical protein
MFDLRTWELSPRFQNHEQTPGHISLIEDKTITINNIRLHLQRNYATRIDLW